MYPFYTNIVHNFFIAFGVVIGASLFNGVGALITGAPPFKSMVDIARSTKIWAVAVALGGTFSSFDVIDKGLFAGDFKALVRQAIYVLMALLGANIGYSLIRLIQRCNQIWGS